MVYTLEQIEKLKPVKPKGGINKRHTTDMQKKAVDNYLSGKYKTKKDAVAAAGYGRNRNATSLVYNGAGVKVYLEKLEAQARKKYGVDLREKSVDVLMEGLDAYKVTKEGNNPDFAVRKQYLDKLYDLMGVNKELNSSSMAQPRSKKNTQVNFFMTNKEDQEVFNTQFKSMMKEMIGEEDE